MTSQVAVMNLQGVAIASDTVVTQHYGDSPKVLGDVPKIYELGSGHKVLILHSGNVRINGVPHQVNLAGWFETLSKPLPTLAAYVDNYRAWIASETRMISPAGELDTINRMLNQVYHELKNEALGSLRWFSPPEGTEKKKKAATEAFLAELANDFFSKINALDPYPGLTDKHAISILQGMELDLPEKLAFILAEVPFSAETISNLMEWSYVVIARDRQFDVDSDLGFVGFGSEEPFAKVIRMNCRGIYGGALRASQHTSAPLEPIINSESIHYFAQYDSMWGFVNGLNTSVKNKYHELISGKIEGRWGAETDELLGDEIAGEITDEINNFVDDTFVQPLLRTVSAMGLQGLADFAESLVALQATSTYSKPGIATVGGLIEVVTIDNVNGVLWHKNLRDKVIRGS
jgi:hypothetical protein